MLPCQHRQIRMAYTPFERLPMQELIDQMVTIVADAGGSIEWEPLLDAVGYKNRAQVPNALKIAKAENKLWRRVFVEDGKSRLVVQNTAPPTPNKPVSESA